MQVIVTGASSGIGIATSKAFAHAGAHVACVARSEANLKPVVEEINSAGKGRATAFPADISRPGGPKQLISKIESELGPIDVLVNNAGITRIGAVIDEPDDMDIWWRNYEVNVRAPVAMIRGVLPSMTSRKTGIVMSVSSAVATMALPAMTAYASSKAAISKFHESLVPELEGTGVLSFAVHPGMVQSNLGKADNALNMSSMEHPAVKAFMAGITAGVRKTQEPELPADVMVALVAEERCKVLNGKHVNADQDLEAVVVEAEKEDGGRIRKERLYVVNIGTL